MDQEEHRPSKALVLQKVTIPAPQEMSLVYSAIIQWIYIFCIWQVFFKPKNCRDIGTLNQRVISLGPTMVGVLVKGLFMVFSVLGTI